MSGARNVVKVRIGSEEYALRSDRSEAHTRAVAEHVNRTLREVQASGTVVDTHKAAILAALSIADELFQLRQTREETARRLHRLSAALERILPPAQRPSRTSGPFASEGGGE